MKSINMKKIKRELYKTFIILMISISMALGPGPLISNEIKKMLEFLNEVRLEQLQEIEEEKDAGELEKP